eukprot:1614176-Amphidinium_carterae.1
MGLNMSGSDGSQLNGSVRRAGPDLVQITRSLCTLWKLRHRVVILYVSQSFAVETFPKHIATSAEEHLHKVVVRKSAFSWWREK